MKKIAFLLTILSLTFATSCKQDKMQTEDIKPPSWSQKNLTNLVPYKLQSFDLKKLQKEDEINDKNKSIPWRFGDPWRYQN